MTCVSVGNWMACYSPSYRLPLNNGGRIYMDWDSYHGPAFYYDKNLTREVDDWWDNEAICAAFDWFCGRGHKA